ncbi:hypothetical protein [Streptomyces marianii]|uniref:Uncharacterized protein n=1 Tax=Streptomyces marianii TaxID=1817406 RepID=A0A5R9DVZ2_9ACTN|nr:hypothetical protein [Streptomyces marianii]TLQ39303.1 hypothetical protein FEF34_38580 [Streptomyces marianii]
MTESALPKPVHPDLTEFLTMARSHLGNLSPAERRVKTAHAARDVLRTALRYDLKHMSSEELVLAIMELRGALAGLLSVTIPAATPPSGQMDDGDLTAHLLDLISDAAPLSAEVSVHVDRALPDPMLTALAQGINAPEVRRSAQYVEALGHCGTSTVHITALAAAGGTR